MTRTMTFSISESAQKVLETIPHTKKSHYVSQAIIAQFIPIKKRLIAELNRIKAEARIEGIEIYFELQEEERK